MTNEIKSFSFNTPGSMHLEWGGAKRLGELLNESPNLRDNIIITSKAGIRVGDTPNIGDPKCYDFSHFYLTQQVENSLQRLNTDYLDMFLLHRPDYLFNAVDYLFI